MTLKDLLYRVQDEQTIHVTYSDTHDDYAIYSGDADVLKKAIGDNDDLYIKEIFTANNTLCINVRFGNHSSMPFIINRLFHNR